MTPSQAAALIGARDGGKFTALLRNPHDRQGMSGDTVDLAALLAEGGAGVREVPVLYGGRSDKLGPDALHLDGYKGGAAPGSMAPVGAMAAGINAMRNVGTNFNEPGTVPVIRSGAASLPSSINRTPRSVNAP